MAPTLINIITITKGSVRENWSSLVLLCEGHPEFSYHYIKRNKFPFEYKGWLFQKEPINQVKQISDEQEDQK